MPKKGIVKRRRDNRETGAAKSSPTKPTASNEQPNAENTSKTERQRQPQEMANTTKDENTVDSNESELLRPEPTYGSVDHEHFGEGLIASSTPVQERPDDEILSEQGRTEFQKQDSRNEQNDKTVDSANYEPRTAGQIFEVPTSEHTEETPLLHNADLENWAGVGFGVGERAQEWQSSILAFCRSRTMWRSVIFILILALLMLVLILQVDFETVTNQAFTPELQSVSVLGIHERGVAFQVIATVETNYGNIDNVVLRQVAKVTALLVGGVVVTPRDNCSVFVTTEKLRGVHLLDVFPPEISVDLVDHRVSDIEFISDANFVEDGAAKLFDAILSHGILKPLNLEIEVRLTPKISGKWFSFQTKTASIFHEIELPPPKEIMPKEIEDFSVRSKGNQSVVSFSSKFDPLPISFSLGPIEWNLALPDCNAKPVILGEGTTSAMNFEPNSHTIFSFAGLIEIPSALLKTCPDGLTPMNRVINSIVKDHSMFVLINAKRSKNNAQSLPQWLFEVLSSISAFTSIPVPEIQNTADLRYDYLINSSSVVVETDDDGNLNMVVDASASIEIESPSTIDFDLSVSRIKSRVLFSKNTDDFLEASVSGTGQMVLSPSPSLSMLWLDYHNVSISISEPSLAGRYLKLILTGSEFDLPDWTMEVEEMFLESPLISTILKDLQFTSKSRSQSNVRTSQENSTFIDWLLESARVSTDKIFCISSSPKHVEFLVDFQVSNPLNVSVGLTHDVLRFDLKYNGTTIGVISLDNFNVPHSKERIFLTAIVTVFYDSSTQRVISEDFLSHVISGSENVFFGISGSKARSLEDETGLSRFLQELSIEGIRLPEVNFTSVEEEKSIQSVNENEQKPLILKASIEEQTSKQSPFLVDATFHLWSSDIELTVFNPIANMELRVQIISCMASYQGEVLAHIEWSEILIIPPGVYVTPRIPIKISNGLGADILRKAINGDLAMDVVAELSVLLDQFPAELMYRGTGLTAKVKI